MPRPTASVAHDLRDLISARFREKVTLREASAALHAHPSHLVRMFSREFGISPRIVAPADSMRAGSFGINGLGA